MCLNEYGRQIARQEIEEKQQELAKKIALYDKIPSVSLKSKIGALQKEIDELEARVKYSEEHLEEIRARNAKFRAEAARRNAAMRAATHNFRRAGYSVDALFEAINMITKAW